MPTLSPPRVMIAERKPAGSDRRRSTREPVVTQAVVWDDAGAGKKQVLVADVSIHGAGLRSTFPLNEGTKYQVEIGVGPLHLSSRLLVIRCRPRLDGTYDVGGEFC